MDNFDNKKNVTRVDSEIEFDIPKEKVNKVFKKIATKTHPDKLINKNDDSKDDSQGSPSETNQDSSNKEKSDAVNKRNNEVKTKKSKTNKVDKLFNNKMMR